MADYKLKLGMFEGPLDLLLYLIRKNELDICDIAICEITDQYLEYINLMKELNLDIVGEFLVMAATLMQIKSRALLPQNPEGIEEEEEDPADDLIRRLQEYKKFKEIAAGLHEREQNRQDLFTRQMDEEILAEMKDDAREVFFEASLFDLINAFNDALKERPKNVVYEVVREEYTVGEKVDYLVNRLLTDAKVRVTDLFRLAKTKNEVIVTFIAVLELIKQQQIKLVQDEMFGEIDVMRNENAPAPVDMDAAKSFDVPLEQPLGESSEESESKSTEPAPEEVDATSDLSTTQDETHS